MVWNIGGKMLPSITEPQPTLKNPGRYWIQDEGRNWHEVDTADYGGEGDPLRLSDLEPPPRGKDVMDTDGAPTAMSDEMRLSEMLDVLSPDELEVLSRRMPQGLDFLGPLVIEGGPRPPGGMRPIPNYDAPRPPAMRQDREAPPQRNRDMYGGSRK
jgi:hypothetical protein